MMRKGSRPRRAGFTLIELLIVIAIIAVLAALLLSAVTRVLAWQQRTETQSEITNMQASLKVAMDRYNKAEYLPSQLILYNRINNYTDQTFLNGLPAADQAIAKQTAMVLRYMFGRRFITPPPSPSAPRVVAWGPGGASGVFRLSGSECLVFYLGGMPGTGGYVGFSDDPLNPTLPPPAPPTVANRIGPFYQFRPNRLQAGPSGVYAHYRDPYGTPYAYFAASGPNAYNVTDCSNLNVAPYYDINQSAPTATPPRFAFLNPNLFQIISAGPDRQFGLGGAWNPLTGNPSPPTGDNLANFTATALSEPQG